MYYSYRQGKAFADCIKTFAEVQCEGDEAAALVLAGYQEAWMLDTLLNMIGIVCPPFGYLSSSGKRRRFMNMYIYSGHYTFYVYV